MDHINKYFEELFKYNEYKHLVIIAIILFISFITYRVIKYFASSCLVTVDQRQTAVIERMGKIHKAHGAGVHFKMPYLDRVVAYAPNVEQNEQVPDLDVITSDNAIVKVTLVLFFKIVDASKALYQTDLDDLGTALVGTAAGIIRSELGKYNLDEVQTNRTKLNESVKSAMGKDLDSWGVIITRAEILRVEVDKQTRESMHKQIDSDRASRASVIEAEGKKKATELQAEADSFAVEKQADAELNKSKKMAEARRIEADAEAYATEVIAKAIAKNGIEAAQYDVAIRQVKALTEVGKGNGKQIIILPSTMAEAFGDAFKMIGKKKET